MTLVIDLPLFVDPDTVVLVFDPENLDPTNPAPTQPYDECPDLESALQYAHDGFVTVAVNPEYWRSTVSTDSPEIRHTAAAIQQALDYEQALVSDCFGRKVFTLA